MDRKELTFDTSMFWDINRTLTHNRLFHFIVGNRGGGKTYGAKKRAIENFIKNKEQFGYIRRYKEDLKEPMVQFFNDIMWEFPDYEFKTDSKYFYIREKPANDNEKWSKDDIAGFGFTLSTADNRKSISYPDITMLIFDEFLLAKGNQIYLSNEPTKFLNLYETVARPGTGHPRVSVFFLANALTITNPYFLYFNLKMPQKKDRNGKWIWKHPTKPILVEDVRNDKFIDAKKNTEFGALIEGTKYAEYSIDNKFLLDDDTFIEKKSGNARYEFTFIYNGKSYGVWSDFHEGKMWVSADIDPSSILVYSLTQQDHTPNTLLFNNLNRTPHLKAFLEQYKCGNVRFESMNIKNVCYEILKISM